jgi:uncharacterized protein (DUF1015 family)
MPRVYSFRGYRYDTSKIGEIADVVTQPYDKIPEPLRQRYLDRHPQNIVRVIKNPHYEEAAAYLNQWIAEGILQQDQLPSLYPYQQVFHHEGEILSRLGFIGLISLMDKDLAVKGHETVLRKPLQDRLSLIRSTESNEGLIFTLFSDPERKVDQTLSGFIAGCQPEFELTDDFGVCHRLWQLTTADTEAELASVLEGKPLYIADGHHRFETSVLFLRECMDKGWQTAACESYDKRMVALFNMDSPEVKILPTHRAVHNLTRFDPNRFLSQLKLHFDVDRCEHEKELFALLGRDPHQIGLVIGSPPGVYLLKLKPDQLPSQAFMPKLSGIARELGVNILHEGLLNPILGIGPKELSSQAYVDYFRDPREMLSKLRGGVYQAAFLLNPTTLEEVRAISEMGEKMPQKSTDFYPKLLTGLVLMKMEIGKS